jgi:hypothetical protein
MKLCRYAVAILLALTIPASATESADKILSGCKIMFGILAENKRPPAGTAMGGGDATCKIIIDSVNQALVAEIPGRAPAYLIPPI